MKSLLLLLLLAPPSPPSRPAPPRASARASEQDEARARFEERLGELKRDLAKRRWRIVEEGILELLAEHRGAEYVRPHLQGLREDLQRAAFWRRADEPDPKSLVQGELLSYDGDSGAIKLRYRGPSLGDFQGEGQAFFHPMHFSGPWTITVEGTPEQLSSASFLVKTGPEEGYLLRFGSKEQGRGFFSYHTLSRITGRELEELARTEPPQRKSKSPTVEAEIEVGAHRLRAKYDGKPVLEFERTEEDYGSLALVVDPRQPERPDLGSLTVQGKIDTGWIGGLFDTALAEQRAEFARKWKQPEVFEAWERGGEAAPEEPSWRDLYARIRFPLRLTPEQQQAYEKLSTMLGQGRAQALALLKVIDEQAEGKLAAEAVDLLRFQCAIELGRPSLALAGLERMQVESDSAADLALLRAQLLAQAQRLEDTCAALEAFTGEHPPSALAYRTWVESLLLLGRVEEAEKVIRRGREELPASASLAQLELRAVKAKRGPAWERVLEERGKHFQVRTDGRRALAREARDVVEEAWARCREYFGPLPAEPTEPSLVYLFSGERSYCDYVEGIADGGHENTLGIYSPHLKQIALWDQPNVQGLWRTLRHECAHRYVDLLLGQRLPRWLNEGHAEVFASAWRADGKWEVGAIERGYLELVAKDLQHALIPTFVHLSDEGFMQKPELSYATAWTITHFLRQESVPGKAVLQRIHDGLRSGEDTQLALARALEQGDVKALQKELFDWIGARLHERGER